MNYLQSAGVRAGKSSLQFALEESLAKNGVTAVRILPDTKIVRTKVPPPHLTLNVQYEKSEDLVVGRETEIAWELRNISRLAARNTTVELEYNPHDLRVIGNRSFSFDRVVRPVSGTFRFVAIRSVSTTIVVRVNSTTANGPAIGLRAIIQARNTSGDVATTWAIRAIGLVAITAFLWIPAVIGLRKRRAKVKPARS